MKISKDYIELVHKFPLVPIKNKLEFKAAMQVLLELGKKDARMTSTERDYFRVLNMLIREYEAKHIKDTSAVSPQELLRFLIEEHNLKQVDIARIIGHGSHVSTFLAGKRNLSKTEAIKLGNYFALDPTAFLPALSKKAA